MIYNYVYYLYIYIYSISHSCDILVILQASDEEQCAALKQMNFVVESQGAARRVSMGHPKREG